MTCWIHWISYLGYLSMSVKTILQWFLSPPLTRVPSLPHSTQFPKCTALSRTSVPMYMSFPLSGMPSLLWGPINSYSPSAKSSMPLGKNYASSPVPQMSSIFFFHHTHHRVCGCSFTCLFSLDYGLWEATLWVETNSVPVPASRLSQKWCFLSDCYRAPSPIHRDQGHLRTIEM